MAKNSPPPVDNDQVAKKWGALVQGMAYYILILTTESPIVDYLDPNLRLSKMIYSGGETKTDI